MKKTTITIIIITGMMSCAPVPRIVKLRIPPGLQEAPTGFDLSTNGHEDQATMNDDAAQFVGCPACHVETLYTPMYVFHPFGDYLLHDIGTGDGIAQAGAPANKLRTAPLWGLRTVSRYLHDGRVFTIPAAITAHRGEALNVTKRYAGLSHADKADLLSFLLSL